MNNNSTPKDFFIHIAATIALYSSVIALINLAIAIINYLVVDELANYFSAYSVAFPISTLVFLVPLLYVLEHIISRDIKRSPEKISLSIRRWRIYLTLFLSGAIIIGDLIYFLNTYLNGEVSMRFVYKIIAVLIIAGIVFAYYLLDIGVEDVSKMVWKKVLAITGIIVTLGFIIAGFAIVGSPNTQREYKFDNQKVSDLSNIQWNLLNYYQTTGKLPPKLVDLKDNFSYSQFPKDPQTDEEYGYIILGENSFKLCADFNRKTRDDRGRGGFGMSSSRMAYDIDISGNNSWEHNAGYTCFERTIDPTRYPKREPIKY